MAAGDPPRLLRVRREKPERLIPVGEAAPPRPPEGLKLTADAQAEPMTLVRLGPVDLEAALAAMCSGPRPSAIVTGLTERPDVTRQARTATAQLDLPWLADSFLFKTALPGYRTAQYLQDLDYTPGRDEEPYTPTDFADAAFTRRVGRSAVGAQFDIGATGGVFAGAFVMSDLGEDWLAINRELLRVSIAARASMGPLPLIAPVMCRLSGFLQHDDQVELVRELTKRRPQAYQLVLDGLHETSEPRRLVAALRIALLLQAVGVPVVLARAGGLRHLFRAFGVRGVELGLGRLSRFRVSDYAGKGGPGFYPPRFEFGSLMWALTHDLTEQVLAAQVLAESACDCRSCRQQGEGDGERDTTGHDAHVVFGESRALDGVAPPERVERFRSALQQARWRWNDVESEGGIEIGRPLHLDRWSEAADLATAAGLLLSPEELASQASLA